MIYVKYSPSTNLGNWLFQYAVARSVDDEVAFYVNCRVAPGRFDNLKRILPDVAFVTSLPDGTVRYKDPARPDALPSVRPLLIENCFQYPELFDEHKIRRLFACPESVRRYLTERYGRVMYGRNCVGVSVRRGDYLKLPHRHPFVGTHYLKRAVGCFPADSLFVVCSDDIAWCKRFFSGKRFPGVEFLFVENEGVLEQLYIHTLCTHNIVSNSSFSWWGAWLNPNPEKRVVFPSRWYGPAVVESAQSLYFAGCEIVRSYYSCSTLFGMWMCVLKLSVGNMLRRMRLR